MLILFGKMWRQARTARVRLGSHRVPVEGALIAAFVGGLGGDYFYGGIIMLTALLTYAPVGALIASTKPQATRLQAHKALPPRI